MLFKAAAGLPLGGDIGGVGGRGGGGGGGKGGGRGGGGGGGGGLVVSCMLNSDTFVCASFYMPK